MRSAPRRHCLVTPHISFLWKILSTHIDHNLADLIDFSGFLFAIAPHEVIHFESNEEPFDDASALIVVRIIECTDPSQV